MRAIVWSVISGEEMSSKILSLCNHNRRVVIYALQYLLLRACSLALFMKMCTVITVHVYIVNILHPLLSCHMS